MDFKNSDTEILTEAAKIEGGLTEQSVYETLRKQGATVPDAKDMAKVLRLRYSLPASSTDHIVD